ncbi:MAG: 30S ribosomal protein S1 [Phycisphaerales bacterium]|nr:30S ribosomal protein S1 [Phycisphaerales bacterium]
MDSDSQQTSSGASGHPTAPPSRDINASLNAEIESALGGMNIQEILEATHTPRPSARAAGSVPIRRTSGGRQLRTGSVMEIRGKDVLVEFGPKSQGICPLDQFEAPPTIGERMEFVIERLDPFEGVLILAREGMVTKAFWGDLRVGQIVEARCVGMNVGGLDMEVAHHHAFMPAAQVDLRHIEDISIFLGEKLQCEIVELRRNRGRMLLSRRRFLERDRKEKRDALLREIELGSTRTATIVALQPFGAFADIGGVDGLIPMGELAHGMLQQASDAVAIGDVVEVKVIRIDLSAIPPRITLSRRAVLPDPVIAALEGLETGSTVAGVVTRLMDFGAFVEIFPGVEGLVHVSEISHDRIEGPAKVLKVGESVQAKVLGLDPQKRRISLSIKALKDAPVRAQPRGREGRDGRGKAEEVQPREADPSMRKLLLKFGGVGSNLKGGLS